MSICKGANFTNTGYYVHTCGAYLAQRVYLATMDAVPVRNVSLENKDAINSLRTVHDILTGNDSVRTGTNNKGWGGSSAVRSLRGRTLKGITCGFT